MKRRAFIQTSILTAAAVTTSAARNSPPRRIRKEGIERKNSDAFWPNGARLAVSISMQFEAVELFCHAHNHDNPQKRPRRKQPFWYLEPGNNC